VCSSDLRSAFLPGDELDCDDTIGIETYFNKTDIKTVLHVDNINWTECSTEVAKTYHSFANASYWIFPILMREIRVWIYSGDVDADVPIPGTIFTITSLREDHGIPIVEPWREWWVKGFHEHEDQVGGMVWALRNLTFVTIRGAGHMVPRDKPREATALLEGFLTGNRLPDKGAGG
jgi:serine carboxypeptidase-like clade 2